MPGLWRRYGRRRWYWAAGVAVAAVILGWRLFFWTGQDQGDELFLASYEGEIFIDPVGKQLAGIWEWHGVNRSGKRLTELAFHVYPRQFHAEVPKRGAAWEKLLGEEAAPGRWEAQRVLVNGQSAVYRVDGTALYLENVHWPPDERLSVSFHFSLFLPKNEGRMSYDEHALWLGNWYPQLAVYEQGRWRADPYYPVGDPFYSQVSDYRLRIRLPRGHALITTGLDRLRGEAVGQWVQYDVEADQARDFALAVVDRHYARLQDVVGDVTVNTWFLSTDDVRAATRLHQVAVQALLFFTETFGPFPYPELDVMRHDSFFDGLAYPGVVFVQKRYFERAGADYGPLVVARQTARQWWSGAVGNDGVKEAWLDESLSEFSAMWFLTAYDPDYSRMYIEGKKRLLAAVPEPLRGKSGPVRRSLEQFADWDIYDYDLHFRGAMALWHVFERLGPDRTAGFLQDYYREYRFREATGEGFRRIFVRHAGKSLWHELEQRLNAR